MASLLLHAGQSVLLKLLSEDRDGRWAREKALHRGESQAIEQQNLCHLIGSKHPLQIKSLYFLIEWGQFPRLELFPQSSSPS